jgi:hypothetical protein
VMLRLLRPWQHRIGVSPSSCIALDSAVAPSTAKVIHRLSRLRFKDRLSFLDVRSPDNRRLDAAHITTIRGQVASTNESSRGFHPGAWNGSKSKHRCGLTQRFQTMLQAALDDKS